MHKIKWAITFFVLVFTALAPTTAKAAPWLERVNTELLSSCESRRLVDFKKVYSKLETDFLEGKRTPEEIEVAKLIFPQCLPETVPMNGIFLVCWDGIRDLLTSKTEKQFGLRKMNLKACDMDLTGPGKDPVRDQWFKCIDNLKF